MWERRKQGRASNGHFLGFWARLNCENMPVIPAWLVRANFDDPRKIPYLLVWKDETHDGEIKEVVRLTCHINPYPSSPHNHVEIKRANGGRTILRIVWRMLPRNNGRSLFLLCPRCDTPRRFVYGWEWYCFSGRSNTVSQVSWRCRSCLRLRYSSEGGYLRPAYGRLGQLGVMLRESWGNLPRPESWLPYVFTSPDAAMQAGVGSWKS